MSECRCTLTPVERKVINLTMRAIALGPPDVEVDPADEESINQGMNDVLDEFAGYEVTNESVRENLIMAIANNIANKTKEATDGEPSDLGPSREGY